MSFTSLKNINLKNHKLKKEQPENPLKELLIKQRKESRAGYPIIKRILFETNFYTITLMTDLAVQNIVALKIQNIKNR